METISLTKYTQKVRNKLKMEDHGCCPREPNGKLSSDPGIKTKKDNTINTSSERKINKLIINV